MTTVPIATPATTATKGSSSKAGSWSPIEQAATDDAVKAGTDHLVALMPGGRQMIAHWEVGAARWEADGRPIEPTHYQPLGPLPSAKE